MGRTSVTVVPSPLAAWRGGVGVLPAMVGPVMSLGHRGICPPPLLLFSRLFLVHLLFLLLFPALLVARRAGRHLPLRPRLLPGGGGRSARGAARRRQPPLSRLRVFLGQRHSACRATVPPRAQEPIRSLLLGVPAFPPAVVHAQSAWSLALPPAPPAPRASGPPPPALSSAPRSPRGPWRAQ